jgi:1-acyl-sn-glycerol-3-phosphate acyltransferase
VQTVSPRSALRLINLGAATLGWVALASAHQALVPPGQRTATFQRYLRRWGSSLVRATGGVVQLVPGCALPTSNKPRLIVANHRSPFDIGVLLSLFGGHALSRADLASWPVLGLAARRAGTIFVDRESEASGASALRTIRRRLSEGATILVFPEGATFEGDEVRPFKPGAFAALRGLDAEIVPVGLVYDPGVEFVEESFVEHVLRVAARPRTRCVVNVGTPLPAHGRAKDLAESAHGVVQHLVTGARTKWLEG